MTRDANAKITSVDAGIVDILGWRSEQMVGSPSTGFIHPEDQPGAVAVWMEMIASPGSSFAWRGRYRTASGSWKWVETVNRYDDTGDQTVESTMTEVSVERVGFAEELHARRQLLSRLSDALPVGVFQVDLNGRVTFTNERLHAIVGVPPVPTIEAQMANVVAADLPLLQDALVTVYAEKSIDDIEIRLHLPGDEVTPGEPAERVCLLSLRALTDSTGVVSGAVGCLSDVTDSVQLRRELEVRASVDALTSCLNRAATLELLDRTMGELRPAGEGTAIVFIDLDRFKSTNDEHGHPAGDRVLVAAAACLRGAVREDDRIGRLGGDEFLAICPRVGSSAAALELADRIAAAMNATVDVGRGQVTVRASIGVAFTTESIDTDTLIAQADSAMYESKRAGQQRAILFAPSE
jgi:diguanylate cyclase (GGDEF)-like protein/PAS domain S-box-containing protein